MSEGGRRLGDAARLGYQIWHRRVRVATQIVHESLFTHSCVRKGFVCVSLLAVTWHGCSHGADWEVFCSVHVLFYSLYSLERMVCTFQNVYYNMYKPAVNSKRTRLYECKMLCTQRHVILRNVSEPECTILK